jgi:hypothetical protein
MANLKPIQEKETPEAKGESEGLSSSGMACASCGLPLDEWKENEGKGVKKEDVLYCSQACAAKGTGSALYPSPIGSGNP